MKKVFNVKTIVEIGLFAAIGYVLDFLAGVYSKGIFINGGSIGIAFICVVIVAYRRGFWPSLLCGFIMGLLDLVDGFWAIGDTFWKAFLQVSLDYVLAYPVCAVSGLFFSWLHKNDNNKNKRMLIAILGVLAAGCFKYIVHITSGFIFFMNGDYLWNITNGYVYVLVYNLAYIGPSTVLVCAIMGLLAYKWPMFIANQNVLKSENKEVSDNA